jgi:hypothetical protein
MADDDTKRLAVLIDADNVSPATAGDLFAEIVKYGTPTIRRAYGDWTTQNLAGWKQTLPRHAIQPIQQFAIRSGKNATDSSLIIDAMDVLYAGNVDGFVIVASDSDYTRLATRLREAGRTVYGIGRRDARTEYVNAFDRFIYLDLLGAEPSELTKPPELEPLLRTAVGGTAKVDGWAILSAVGSYLSARNPGFDVRDYGFGKLGELVRAQDYVEVREVPGPAGLGQLHVRIPRSARAPGR